MPTRTITNPANAKRNAGVRFGRPDPAAAARARFGRCRTSSSPEGYSSGGVHAVAAWSPCSRPSQILSWFIMNSVPSLEESLAKAAESRPELAEVRLRAKQADRLEWDGPLVSLTTGWAG